MIALAVWIGRLWSALHWIRWPWLRSAAFEPDVRASAEAALERIAAVENQLGIAQSLLSIGALILAGASLRWSPRWFASAVLALCFGLLAVRFAFIE